MPFETGHEKIPGSGMQKGQVCGRKKALGVLDTVAGKAKNLKALAAAFQDEFDNDPLRAWEKYVYPNLAKEMKIEHEGSSTLEQYLGLMLDAAQKRREERHAQSGSG